MVSRALHRFRGSVGREHVSARRLSMTAALTALAMGALVLAPGGAAAAGGLPTVLSVSPSEGNGSGGTKVTIAGEGLAGATTVYFGATAVTVTKPAKSEKKLKITAPPGTGTVDVTVTTPNGTSEVNPGDQFTYAAVPAPTVEKVNPDHGFASEPRTVKISGESLGGATEVHFGAQSVPFTVSKPTLIEAMVPAATMLGTVDVRVTTPTGTSAITPADHYTFIGKNPVLNGLDPGGGPAGGGNTVLLLGEGFIGATNVAFGDIAATSFEVVSDVEIEAVAPPETTAKVTVAVTTPRGTTPTMCTKRGCTPPPRYLFGPPTVTLVSPGSGPLAGATPITVIGTGFGTGPAETTIEIGHREATSVDCPSTMECTAVTPEGKQLGAQPVTMRIHSGVDSEQNHNEESPAAVFSYE
jgi:IPT/TIG domain